MINNLEISNAGRSKRIQTYLYFCLFVFIIIIIIISINTCINEYKFSF